MLFPIILLILLIIYNIISSNFEISPQYSLFIYFFSFIIGFFLVNQKSYNWLYIAVLFFIFSISSNLHKKKYKTIVEKKIKRYQFHKLFYYVIIFFIAYHYVKGGIPALSNNVVTERFNLTSSGMFGIPGRMANYGRYILFFYSYYFYNLKSYFPEYNLYNKYFYVSLFVNVLCSLFAGTKGSILNLIYLLVYVFSFSLKPVSIKKFIKPKILIPFSMLIILGFTYFYYFFNAYGNSFSSMGFWNYIIYRLTNMSVESGAYLLEHSSNIKITYFSELIYYIQKYFHITLSKELIYPVEVYVSTKMYNTPFTTAYAYYTPVTVGIGAEFIYHFGILSLIAIWILGRIYSYAVIFVHKFKEPFSYASICLLILFINTFIGRGNLIYYSINYLLVVAMIYFIYKFCNYFEYTFKKYRK